MNPNKHFSVNPLGMIRSFSSNRQLIWQMAKRDIIGRYRGSFFGLAWSFFNPLIMLLVYTFVFSVIFKARWHTGSDSKVEFALALFVGLIVHGLFADCINRAPSLILSNVSFVKKVVFPLEILSWVVTISTIFHSLISLFVWSLFFIIVNHIFYWTAIFVPLVFIPLILFTIGFSWFLSSLGVFFRDVNQIVGVFTTVLLFLAPVFYPATLLPLNYRKILYLNPLTFVIEQARDVLMAGKFPDWTGFVISFIASLCVAWIGYAWFQKTRRGFADVL